MDIFSFTYIILSFQTLELITALRAGVTAIANTVNSTCNRVPELRPISTWVIVPIFMIPPHPLPNQNSHFIISSAMAKVRKTNNRVIARGKRRHFVIKKNVQLLIRILFREKFIQYTSEKNLSEFYFTKKYSDYLLVLRRHVLRETFY